MDKHFSQEYLGLKISYLQNELKKLADVRVVKHRGKLVSVSYKKIGKKYKRTESVIRGEQYAATQKIIETRKELVNKINQLKLFLDKETVIPDAPVNLTPPRVLPISIKETLKNDANTLYPKKYDYWYKGIQYRSRLELLTAVTLDSLGLEFYYEPEFNINGKVCYPDFVVFLPELGCCFVIECMGMSGSADYVYNNVSKQAGYVMAGIIPNMNFLVFYGTDTMMPPAEDLKMDIINIINKITWNRVRASRNLIDEYALY